MGANAMGCRWTGCLALMAVIGAAQPRRRSKCGGRVGPPFLVPTRERRCELTADASSVNESGKIENGKTHVFRGPRARAGWGVEEGPEEGWGDGGSTAWGVVTTRAITMAAMRTRA
jgi:hypothetical protein